MQPISIAILGGDLRQCYLADYMYIMRHDVTCYSTMPFSYKGSILQASLKDAVLGAQLILCPIPFSKDGITLFSSAKGKKSVTLKELLDVLRPGQSLFGGNIPAEFTASCMNRQVSVIDLMKEPSLTLANAALTAEGLLSSLIAETPFSLFRRRLLLLGFGRCGQEIGKQLAFFDMHITAYDNDISRLAKARTLDFTALTPEELPLSRFDYDLVINTIPMQVITRDQLNQLPDACILFDIASAPGGFDDTIIKELNRKLFCCPGIPGRFMPQTAAELIGKTVLERML